MRRSRSLSLVAASALGVALALTNTASAQAPAGRGDRGGPPAPPPTVLNLGSVGIAVQNLDASVPNEPFAIELVEYTGIERTPMLARHNDPGASFLNFGYVDVGAAFDAVRTFNPRMVGTNAFPTGANPGGGLNAAWIRDPDGMMIELMHGGWDGVLKSFPSVHNVVTPGGVPVAVSNMARFDVVSGSSGPTAGPVRVNTSRQILVHDPGGFPVLLMQRTN